MKQKTIIYFVICLAVLVSAWQQAAQATVTDKITTLFGANNGTNGAMFDVTNVSGLSIELTGKFEGNYDTSQVVQVWYRTGTYVGHESDLANWILLGSTNVAAQGLDTPSSFDIGNTLTIPPGQTMGLFIYSTGMCNYTNGDGTNQLYSNGIVEISCGVGKTASSDTPPVTGTTQTPRVWNGSIEYRYENAVTLAAAEYFIDIDPGEGNGTSLEALDGTFDSSSESVEVTGLILPGLAPGDHTLYIRYLDSLGDWSEPQSSVFTYNCTIDTSTGAPVPDTGQTTSYTNTFGEDSDYLINPPSYTKLDASGNDLPITATSWVMVRDNVTGLIWEVKQNKDGTKDYTNPHDADNTYTWYDSDPATNGGDAGTPGDGTDTEDFINAVNSENFGGFADWRMPTIEELHTITNLDQYDPAVDMTYFPNVISSYYWSGSTYADVTDRAWVVDFNGGGVIYDGKTGDGYVRCVRSGPSVIGSFDYFALNDDGLTVTDAGTGLMWEKATGNSGTSLTWENAIQYCESLDLAGYTDWRLPTVSELQTLVDYSLYNPSIDTNYFNDILSSAYWSGSTYAGGTYYAWVVSFYNGLVGHNGKTGNVYVRCVRSGSSVIGSFENLVIYAPSHASFWLIGDTMPISWATRGISGDVRISLSRDGGKTYTDIVSSTPNDGSYNWTVTGTDTFNAMIRVEPLNDTTRAGTQGLFSIVSTFTPNQPPEIVGTIPDQTHDEDDPPWTVDLTPYEMDAEDSGTDLDWSVGTVSGTYFSASITDSDGDILTFTPVAEASGFETITLILTDSEGLTDTQDITITLNPVNDPPAQPFGETPSDGATGVSINADLGWSCTDPEGDALTYDVYFGTANPPATIIANDQSGTTCDPGLLQYSTTYYWRVDATDANGATTQGTVWSFTTEANPLYIVAAEYFIDTDPGEGNASPLAADDGAFNSMTENVSVTGLTLPGLTTGSHTLYIRYRDSLGNWSQPTGREFVYNCNLYIDAAEYFIDTDPGEGNGTALAADDGAFDSMTETVSVTGLTLPGLTIGAHTLNIRYRDSLGNWTEPTSRTFYYYCNANQPPDPPFGSDPADGATGVSINADLSWSGSDPENDALTFDVYFGTVNPPISQVFTAQSDFTFDPGILQYSTTYTWRVDATDAHGLKTQGSVWNFTTEAEPNHLPDVSTQAQTSITTSTAMGHGTIIDPGLPLATAHGVCWNTTGSPNINNDDHTDEGPVSGTVTLPYAFTSAMTGLLPDTEYYVRAYATNGEGTAYGNALTFTTNRSPAGFYVSAISGNTGEDGTAATFTASLTAAPHADVTLSLQSSDTGEGTVSPTSLTFTSGNWNVDQTVTVTGVDDAAVDGDQSYEIQFGAAVSTDAAYDGLTPDPVSVVNVDDDSASGSGIYLPFLNLLLDE